MKVTTKSFSVPFKVRFQHTTSQGLLYTFTYFVLGIEHRTVSLSFIPSSLLFSLRQGQSYFLKLGSNF